MSATVSRDAEEAPGMRLSFIHVGPQVPTQDARTRLLNFLARRTRPSSAAVHQPLVATPVEIGWCWWRISAADDREIPIVRCEPLG